MKINILGQVTTKDEKLYRNWTQKVLEKIKTRIPQKVNALNIVIVNDRFIQKLNKNFLDRNYPTDVLAFPLAQPKDKTFPKEEVLWGEIYISKDHAAKQAQELGITLHTEICNLITHGILHLAGYSHQAMKKIESALTSL
ncbi:MAG: rRNA maturation RNase YbeY [candidate division WOR-3 bacterium]|nr:rRNA maturation RNase YbeY [candidate division WOR-3 bacterium]MCX7756699.1 rRNA maturation RNase YbeY [candidate division WOR-3 bacterium]MDW7987874.1 rRNA maturation RNase YbeY [candidate division WOR-3 bacterium]